MVVALGMVACSEDDGTIEEYPDWRAKNEAYFQQLVNDAQARQAGGDASWVVLKSYSKPQVGYTLQYDDYIVVQKLENGKGTTSPLGSDSVAVHYAGRLLPSTSYPQGLEFDRSFTEPFDLVVATPVTFAVNKVVNGFATALLNMHRGDHWKVYIPYRLGYGETSGSSTIPDCSTLIFDIRLDDFWLKEQGDRN